jgi:hypothetical protein
MPTEKQNEFRKRRDDIAEKLAGFLNNLGLKQKDTEIVLASIVVLLSSSIISSVPVSDWDDIAEMCAKDIAGAIGQAKSRLSEAGHA